MNPRETASALLDFFRTPIDGRGTPYRHCHGCDNAQRPHTCQLCQRCLSPDHDHTTCNLEPVP